MPNKDTQYQTLSEFMNKPFGNQELGKNVEYDKKYKELVGKKLIYCENCTELDGMYMIHIIIPSETQSQIKYDVVIQFFTDDDEVAKQNNLGKYYLQFYSNCPSFIYQYSALYRVHGYLIEALYDKMDPEYVHTLPDKANPKYTMSYDKSIYYACKFIFENQYTLMRKSGLPFYHLVKPKVFFRSVKDYEEIKSDAELYKLEDSLKRETEKEKQRAREQRAEILNKLNPFSRSGSKSTTKQPKKKPTLSTVQDPSNKSVKNVVKKKPGTHTGNVSSVHKVVKKKGGFGTKR